jgi:hypothetical protein
VDIPEYNKRLGKVIQQTQNFDNGQTIIKVAAEATRLIKTRIQETGIDAKGDKFRAYSTKPMLVGCKSFIQKDKCTKLFGSKKKRKELEWRTVNGHHLAILEGGYKELRAMQGRRVDITNFSMTNDMWNDINVISGAGDHISGMAIIGARKLSEKKKLEGNTKRFGDILDLRTKEIEELMKTYKLDVLQIFKENGIN